MNLDQIETKCFILALFIRDDGERFLLGSRMFEFVDSQLHFTANAYQNDVVEVQGNDGLMLAGQVRRGNSQAFDGYIGDSSVDKATIEQNRRDFMKFFRKNHYYKVVYIFPDKTAIQRRQGFIVEAPEVKELYQLFPQYHISMNFEDINYYNYEEDSEGEEIYGESATLKVATSATGGLIWADNEQETVTEEGTDFTIQNTSSGTTLSSVQLKGDTEQQTYSGKNLFKPYQTSGTITVNTVTFTMQSDGSIFANGVSNGNAWVEVVYAFANQTIKPTTPQVVLQSGTTYILSCRLASGSISGNIGMVAQMNASSLEVAVWNVNGGSSTVSNADGLYRCWFRIYNGSTFNNAVLRPQLEVGSSVTSFEPYVGGIPAPNPDYPQEVQTVTGQQVVTISDGDSQSQEYEVNLGKNLLDASNATADTRLVANGGTTAENGFSVTDYIKVSPNTTYTLSSAGVASGYYGNIIQYNGSKTMVGERLYISNTNTSYTFTTESDAVYVRISHGTTVFGTSLQLEKGSTATSYSAYFTPIELCKIGTYQDYIYKSGSDWYIHKAVGKSMLGDLTWYSAPTSQSGKYRMQTGGLNSLYAPPTTNTEPASAFVTHFKPVSQSDTWNCVPGLSFNMTSAGKNVFIYTTDYNTSSSASSFKTWCSNNNVVAYYALATATDTQITNASLISQLNALAGATTYSGQTVFTVNSENQLAILRVAVLAGLGGGVVWDEYGAEWEEGTGGGPTTISVDSIDNVYPVWELTGPATNPQISVLTTNTTLSYSGTVTASQTLKIDMFNKTATLNGTSVVGNVSGDWVYLAPGTNRVTYTTGNADAPDSTIWWQEIVG